ncbi:polyphosphate--glucose phosphotransferase [Motilimonas eburnea]|uniref:polyphosphate--glucose phosphotransferase n=1 Tax=Motilimonas eburnea TaxID=1737488 RepID=UPI001E3A300C|nr:ROK family protein [Motilimonas eburnea]MCE2570584.1 ROK family protein [Motilimonas eburnea]
MQILGVDIGGSGIKGAIVETTTGELVTERHRIPTPQPATPESVADTLKQLVDHFDWQGPVGCGFPATVVHGVAKTASNIDKSWINTNAAALFSERTHCPCFVVNDADAAGMAEFTFGAGQGKTGVVVLITIGTGLGTAVFTNGQLLPNTELGHIMLEGMVAEHYTADSVRKREELGWNKWGKRFNKYLQRLEFLLSPDCFILGGGASKKLEKFAHQLETDAEVIPAQSLNQAGIIGAALFAQSELK